MERFAKEVAGNSRVEFIHVSRDQSEDRAEEWAAQEEFPWLTVLPGDVERSGLLEYHTREVVPFYALVDGDGKELATGSTDVFAKLSSLAGD